MAGSLTLTGTVVSCDSSDVSDSSDSSDASDKSDRRNKTFFFTKKNYFFLHILFTKKISPKKSTFDETQKLKL